jgi:RNA polymerase sigma-70 factor (ECF subfamily)
MNTAALAAAPVARPAAAGSFMTMPAEVGWADLVSHRSYLVRFAQRRLHDPLLAEDAVHDVFEAVLSGRAVFAGRAALRSWLTAVLKNKIVDTVRRNTGFESTRDIADDDGALAIECPQPRPDEIAEQQQLLARTLARIEALPSGLRDVMRLRVLDEQPTEAVCRQLGISEENLFVRLHRARKQLMS